MSGIFSLLNNNDQFNRNFIETQFQKGKPKSPVISSLREVGLRVMFGSHETQIIESDLEFIQPIRYKDIVLICNGEIYNAEELYKMMGIQPESCKSAEVIIYLYMRYGMEYTLRVLDGEFCFMLLDNNLYNDDSKLYVARDPYGVKPLYVLKPNYKILGIRNRRVNRSNVYGFASEFKVLHEFCYSFNNDIHSIFDDWMENPYIIQPFQPGTYSVYSLGTKARAHWKLVAEDIKYTIPAFSRSLGKKTDWEKNKHEVYSNLQSLLIAAVEKRCLVTDEPVACLLTGDLNSSLITALVSDYHKKRGMINVETFSIGFENCENLKYARIVAEYLGTKHTEVIVTEEDLFDAVPDVIRAIETFDLMTVRASLSNYLLGKYISENSKAKIIFSGCGGDELMGKSEATFGKSEATFGKSEATFGKSGATFGKSKHFYIIVVIGLIRFILSIFN